MSQTVETPKTKTRTRTERPKLYKVMLVNDDFTPRDFVVLVLKAVFRLNADEAYVRMMTAHQNGVSVVAVYTREIAESKASEAVDLAREAQFPLMFTTEPEQ